MTTSSKYNRGIFTIGSVTYTDIDLGFKTNPVTGDIRKKTDVDSIIQSLTNILLTNPGERPFQPGLAGGVSELLFEPLDQVTEIVLKKQIATSVGNHEPRITLIALEINSDPDEETVDVTFKFNMENVFGEQSINIVLQRIR